MNPNKVKAILEPPAPKNGKVLSRFSGQIRWHNWMIRYLVEFVTPVHAVVYIDRCGRKRILRVENTSVSSTDCTTLGLE